MKVSICTHTIEEQEALLRLIASENRASAGSADVLLAPSTDRSLFACLTPGGAPLYENTAQDAAPQELTVKSNGMTRLVHTRDIFYIESAGRKVILHAKKENIEYYERIGNLEAMLKGLFYRVHKGYLVNLRYVERFDRTSLLMKNGDTLLISRKNYPGFALLFGA